PDDYQRLHRLPQSTGGAGRKAQDSQRSGYAVIQYSWARGPGGSAYELRTGAAARTRSDFFPLADRAGVGARSHSRYRKTKIPSPEAGRSMPGVPRHSGDEV